MLKLAGTACLISFTNQVLPKKGINYMGYEKVKLLKLDLRKFHA